MSVTARHVAHHFDDAEQQFTAAELGMWLFLATEVMFFGGLFCGYIVYRHWYPAAFVEGSHHLNVPLGAINTTILLTSSLTMVLAVHSAQTSQRRATVGYLILTILLGSAFLGVKVFEYRDKFEHRLVPGPHFAVPESDLHATPGENPVPREVELFFSLYFLMTGLHALHMIIGVVLLGVITVAAARGAFSAEYFTPVEMSGLYWHFVDIVWVFLFPLLYLIH